MTVVGRHAHHLGAWDPALVLQLSDRDGTWRAPTPEESSALVGDGPADAVLFTVPAWLAREIASIDWSDGTRDGDTREQSQFGTYSSRVLEFLSFLAVPLGNETEVRLVATTGHSAAPPQGEVPAGVVLVNVGDVPLRVTFQRMMDGVGVVAVIIGVGHGCVISPAAWPWAVSLAGAGEYGLHLETPVLRT